MTDVCCASSSIRNPICVKGVCRKGSFFGFYFCEPV